MAKKKSYLTQSHRATITAEYARLGARVLAERLGVPKSAVKNFVYAQSLQRDPAHLLNKPFSPEELAVITARYAGENTQVLAKELRRTVGSVTRQAYKLGLKKSEAFMASTASGRLKKGDARGANTRFRKGQVAFNKGRKMRPEVYAKVARTMFKKGRLPHNTKYDGHISARKDQDGRTYFHIRVALGTYVHLHRYLWEQAHGTIPEGHVIAFKDGNQGNCVLENLECITSAERMLRTTIMNYPPEIRNVMRLLGKFNRTIKAHGEQ